MSLHHENFAHAHELHAFFDLTLFMLTSVTMFFEVHLLMLMSVMHSLLMLMKVSQTSAHAHECHDTHDTLVDLKGETKIAKISRKATECVG